MTRALLLLTFAQTVIIVSLLHREVHVARKIARLKARTEQIQAGVRAGMARDRAYTHLIQELGADGDEP